MQKILIIGAASAIAHETAKLFASEGAKLYLTDLKFGRLEAVKYDIEARYKNAEIWLQEMDSCDYDLHGELFMRASEALGGIDAVLIAHGVLPNQEEAQKDTEEIVRQFHINALSVIALASTAANYFEQKKAGTIAVISSVAGDRGRQSNYIYGAAKGAVTVFLQGLRNRLSPAGVKVVTIKPGMVDTPMTSHLKKNFLFANASKVAQGIYDAMKNGKDEVYVPGYWKLVMMGIKSIPESVFKKLKL